MTQRKHIRPGRRPVLVVAIAACGALAVGGAVAYKLTTEQDGGPPEASPTATKPVEARKEPAVSKKIDYSKLDFRGNGFDSDSFCMAVAETARLLGREVSYEQLLALTTNAFAPGFDTGNDCKELWIANAWVSRLGPIDTAWRHLGLSVEPLPFAEHEAAADDDAARLAHHRTCANVVRDAMARGSVVVTTGGWEHRREWVEPWWAGIITEVREDGTVLGSHLNGRTGCELADLNRGEVFAVSLTEPSLGIEEANVELLRHAINRIRAKGKPGAFGRHEFCAFGVDAMDDWIAQMRDVPHFCPPCQEKHARGWRSAEVVARAAVHRSSVAAAWLRERCPGFPEAVRPRIIGAAEHYDRIVELLRPALTGDGGESYEQFIGDIEKQKAHAENVLKPAKAELAAAADEMEKALRATEDARLGAKVKREGGRVVIPGLSRLELGKGRDNQLMGALDVALRGVVVNGAAGRMGRRVAALLAHDADCELVGAVEAGGSSDLGRPLFGREGEADVRRILVVGGLVSEHAHLDRRLQLKVPRDGELEPVPREALN